MKTLAEARGHAPEQRRAPQKQALPSLVCEGKAWRRKSPARQRGVCGGNISGGHGVFSDT